MLSVLLTRLSSRRPYGRTREPWQVQQIDCNIIAEAPRLGAHKPSIRSCLAALTNLPLGQVSIKARSHEQCDAIGAKKALACQALVVLNNS